MKGTSKLMNQSIMEWKPQLIHDKKGYTSWGWYGCVYDPKKDRFLGKTIEYDERNNYVFIGRRYNCRGETLPGCYCLPEDTETAKKRYEIDDKEQAKKFGSHYSQPWV